MKTEATYANRRERLMPGGIPRYMRVYDNEGESLDRYTVVYTGKIRAKCGEFPYLSMNAAPFHPQGIGQHGSSQELIDVKNGWPPAIGRKCHLGKRIPFAELPADCQKLAMRDYVVYWDLAPEEVSHVGTH